MCEPSRPSGIVLIGFMGAGKSSVGRKLGSLTGWPFVDLDAEIVRREGRTIPQMFADPGEPYFRQKETEALRSLTGGESLILATGGGIIGREENWSLLRQLGTIVYLQAGWVTLHTRLKCEEGRPLGDGHQGWEKVEALWRRRLPLYQQADIIIETEGLALEAVAERVLEQVRHWSGR